VTHSLIKLMSSKNCDDYTLRFSIVEDHIIFISVLIDLCRCSV